MKALHFPSVKPIKISKFLLSGIGVGLILIHLNLTWRSGNTNFWAISVLFWIAICYLLWKNHKAFSLKTGVFPTFLGIFLIALILLKDTSSGKFIYISPLISAVGLSLIASGFKGLKQYWEELLILFFLGIPQVTILSLIDISALTAKFATFVLWHLGFEVYRQGVTITLNTGSVEVYPGCSGIESILHLGGLAVIFLVMFPTDGWKQILVPVVAVLLAFVVNGVRVALMAVLVASSNLQAFEYWHHGDGSLTFSLISVLFFLLFCFFLLGLDELKNKDSL